MMQNKDYIIKDPQWQASQNYKRLRKEGLKHIEKLGHQLWTDYNIHDPGITQLELLCYAITDLGHRTHYDIKDILTTEEKGIPVIRDEFHTARDIFSCNPVSFNDLRKLLIDIEGISNAWIEKHSSIQFCVDEANEVLRNCTKSEISSKSNRTQTLNGLYDVYIDYDEPDLKDADKQLIIEEVKERLLANRNLCEDVINICDLDKEDIALCADLEVKPSADLEAVMLEVYYQLDQFISPDVKFYTIQELLDKGKSTDEIFAGPALNHGFIDDDEFRQIERHCALRVSDIIQIIMDIPDVVSVKEISLLSFIDGVKRDQQKWILNLATDEFRSPAFNPSLSRLTFYKNGMPYFARLDDIESLLNEKRLSLRRGKLNDHEKDLPIPIGDYKALEDYYPVQNEMPANYQVGKVKVPESATTKRKAQSKQLKAWLLFFEQMLANYLSQLAHMHELFSWQHGTGKTYFTQQVSGIHDLENLYNTDYIIENHGNLGTALNSIIESDVLAEQRKNKFLDHLLARFCESFTDYSALMYNLDGDFTQQRLIADKREFLEHYPQLSQQRGQGFDYRDPKNSNNISGYQKRTYRLLGIDELTRRDFAWQGFSIKTKLLDGKQQWQFLLKNDQGKLLFHSIPCESKDSIEALLDLALRLGCCSKNYQPASDGNSQELVQHCDGETSAHIIGNTESKDMLTETLGYFQDYSNNEGFHVIEHSLLRRRGTTDPYLPIQLNTQINNTKQKAEQKAERCDCVEVRDPYSFHFSIILPSWPRRFQDLRFRQFVEDTLRMEAPAHIQTRICWLSHTQMQQLENSYNTWAELLSEQVETMGTCHAKADFSGQLPMTKKIPDTHIPDADIPNDYTQALDEFIKTLHSLTTVYPLARLHDCEHIDTDAPPITLNNTILGTF